MTEWSILLLWLFITHMLADFYFQPLSWVYDRNEKHFRSVKVVWHSLIQGGLSSLVIAIWQHLYDLGISLSIITATLLITISHYLIDITKSYSSKGVVPLLVDQLAHIFVLFGVAVWLAEPEHLFDKLASFIAEPKLLILLLGYLIILNPASIAIRMLLERWNYVSNEQDSLPQAGNLIGQLERVLLLSCILLDNWASIGLILAAKSVFRFGDLTASKDRKLTEYVMLGTLVSVIVTLIVAVIIKSITGSFSI